MTRSAAGPKNRLRWRRSVPKERRPSCWTSGGRTCPRRPCADLVRRWRDQGRAAAVFLIGGPDGVAQNLRDEADLCLAFGAATWPHQLVRIMLLEQLYRVVTILAGHPYHRAGDPNFARVSRKVDHAVRNPA